MRTGAAYALPLDSTVRAATDGALYIVDWGEIEIAPERGGNRMQRGTGTLWRIRRTKGPSGERSKEPLVVPLYVAQYLLGLVGVVGLLAFEGWLLKRWLGSRK